MMKNGKFPGDDRTTAGFWKGYNITDHLQTPLILIEKTTEYNVPIHLTFIDFNKAFDTIETHCILEAMDNAKIESRFTAVFKDIYDNAEIYA